MKGRGRDGRREERGEGDLESIREGDEGEERRRAEKTGRKGERG